MAEAAAAKARRPRKALGCILQRSQSRDGWSEDATFHETSCRTAEEGHFILVLVFHIIIPGLQSRPTCSGDTH
jgi:hypothetical protein